MFCRAVQICDMKNKTKTHIKRARYNPNHIPAVERIINVILSVILFTYGTIGVVEDDIYMPGKRNPGTHFHGVPALILYGAFLFAVANLMAVVVDHYDRRNNEKNYKLLARITQIAGWTLFALALLLDVFVFEKGTQ